MFCPGEADPGSGLQTGALGHSGLSRELVGFPMLGLPPRIRGATLKIMKHHIGHEPRSLNSLKDLGLNGYFPKMKCPLPLRSSSVPSYSHGCETQKGTSLAWENTLDAAGERGCIFAFFLFNRTLLYMTLNLYDPVLYLRKNVYQSRVPWIEIQIQKNSFSY